MHPIRRSALEPILSDPSIRSVEIAVTESGIEVPRGIAVRRASLRLLRGAWKLIPVVVILGVVVWFKVLAPVAAQPYEVRRGEVTEQVFGRGTVEARREAQLGFDMAGRLSDVLVDEGDRVKLGQELAHLAPEQYEAEVRTAASGASLARAALTRLQADQKRAEAALAFAESEEARARGLVSAGSLPQRDLDLATEQLSLARAELARVEAQRAEAARNIDVAKGGVDLKRAIATRTALVSPFDGIVLRRFRDPGDPVAVGATVLRVVATDDLWVRAWIDETALGQLHEGQPATVVFPEDERTRWAGRIARIGRESDRQTHELLVDIAVDKLPPRVAVGQRADVLVQVDRKEDVVRVPLAYVQRDPSGKPWCWVDRGGRIARADLGLGVMGRDDVEVTSGLSEGDTVLNAIAVGGSLPAGRRWKAAVAP